MHYSTPLTADEARRRQRGVVEDGEAIGFNIMLCDSAGRTASPATADATSSARDLYIDNLTGMAPGTNARTAAMRDAARSSRNLPVSNAQAVRDAARQEFISSLGTGGIDTSAIRDAARAARNR